MITRTIQKLILIALITLSASVFAQSEFEGFYVGASLGDKQQTSDWNTNILAPSSISLYTVAITPATATPSFNSNAPRFGGYLGYNFGVSQNWILGAEADFSWANNSDKVDYIPGTYGHAPDNTTVKTTWDSSLRGRIGYLVLPDWLLYGAGGLTMTQAYVTQNCFYVGGWCGGGQHSETYSKTMVGWTAGTGVEAVLSKSWIARLEYRYSDSGSFTHTFLPPNSSDDNNGTIKINSQIVNLGIAYKF
jgi:outer membrane immunogenic protein